MSVTIEKYRVTLEFTLDDSERVFHRTTIMTLRSDAPYTDLSDAAWDEVYAIHEDHEVTLVDETITPIED